MTRQTADQIDYLKGILEFSPDLIILGDKDGKAVACSDSVRKILGYHPKNICGKPITDLYYNPADRAKLLHLLELNNKVIDYETRLKTQSGRPLHISTSVAYYRDDKGEIVGTIGIAKNIRRRKELEKKLVEMAVTDGLTKLYDRGHFNIMIDSAIEKARRLKYPLSLIMIDLDGFKEYNDKKGHLEGDRVLQEVGAIIRQTIRPKIDSAFRYGGDEFVIIIPGQYQELAARFAEKMRKETEQRFNRLITASIGVTRWRPHQNSYYFIKLADESMYRAKTYGGNRVCVS
ncbi:MAG: sensor domain-containing diguanylate cyclase [Planctomycetes bacterium]|nr:sensor domain-containing diguanylate cyclase [Planctomycetota bacterium]